MSVSIIINLHVCFMWIFKIEGWIFVISKDLASENLPKGEENMIGQKLYYSVFLNLIKSNLGKYEMTSCSLLVFF